MARTETAAGIDGFSFQGSTSGAALSSTLPLARRYLAQRLNHNRRNVLVLHDLIERGHVRLHNTCRQCTYFNPASCFECRKPITARIMNKGGRNTCELFASRTVIERETSSGKPTDARQAFANLFKK